MKTLLRFFSISIIFVALVFAIPVMVAQRQPHEGGRGPSGGGQKPAAPAPAQRGPSGGGQKPAAPAPAQRGPSGVGQRSAPAPAQRGGQVWSDGGQRRSAPPDNRVRDNDGRQRRPTPAPGDRRYNDNRQAQPAPRTQGREVSPRPRSGGSEQPRFGGRSHGRFGGWGYHGYHHNRGWGWRSFGLWPWYWSQPYWGPTYSWWWGPWFSGWTVVYVVEPYPYGVACERYGVRFNTSRITNAEDKKLIRESEVYADGGYVGIVKDFDRRLKEPLRLEAGNHEIEIRFPNGQSFVRTVAVRTCEITVIHMPPLPPPPPKQETEDKDE